MKTRLANRELRLRRNIPARVCLIASCLILVSDICSAQYSTGVVGYVNVQLTNGYTLVANPLRTANDTLTNLIRFPPEGTRVYVWDVTDQVFFPPSVYHASPPGWTADYDLPVGRGFVVFAPVTFTNTFVGEVLQGWLTNFVAGDNKLSLLGNKVPDSGPISSALGFPRIDGAHAHSYSRITQAFEEVCTYFDGFGWFDPKGESGPGGPICEPAEAFFIRNPGPPTNWIRHFIVQAALPEFVTTARNLTASGIRTFSVAGGKATLHVRNPGGHPYRVEFSNDGRKWTTVSVNQTRDVWVGPLPSESQGYFRLINP